MNKILTISSYILSLGVFFPTTYWLFEKTYKNSQLLNCFYIFLIASVFLFITKNVKMKFDISPSRRSFFLMLTSFILLVFVNGFSSEFSRAFVLLLSFCFALLSVADGVLHSESKRFFSSVILAFFVYTLMVLFMDKMDFTFRLLAAKWSGSFLSLFSSNVQIILRDVQGAQLELLVNGRNYLVASECNGLGIISTSILLSVLVCLFRNITILDKFLIVLASASFAFFANILRIFIIINLAPKVKDYHLMHEIVGNTVFVIALVTIWVFVSSSGKRLNKEEKS